MLSASRYLSCTLTNGRIQISHIGTLGAAVPSYWSREHVAAQMDDKLDRAIHTLSELDAAQAESLSRYVPLRMVFVADNLEEEVRRRSKIR
jgi:hypothetical protein